MTYHAIDLEFKNELGQHVFVITCPVAMTTIAIVNAQVCTCGKEL